jgi:hypothetical protein
MVVGSRQTGKARACSSFCLTLEGLFTKNSSWQAKQFRMLLCPDCGDRTTACRITAHSLTGPVQRGMLTVGPHEVREADSQAVPNTSQSDKRWEGTLLRG